MRQLCEWKGIKIVKAKMCPDHVHTLVEIPQKLPVSSFMEGAVRCCANSLKK